MTYIKNNFPSLKKHDNDLEDHYYQRKNRHNRNQMNILYPETSLLDTFMEKQGLHKKLRHNVKIVNGEVKFNRLQKNKKTNKTIEIDTEKSKEE